MRSWLTLAASPGAVLTGVAALALAAAPAFAQTCCGDSCGSRPSWAAPCVRPPTVCPAPFLPPVESPAAPSTTTPTTPSTTPSTTTPSTDTTTPQMQSPESSMPSLSAESGSAGVGSTVALADGGYIDSAIPRTMFRLRFDAAYDDNRPDRAEFFYAKCGCFGTPDAKGPPLSEASVDYQDISGYLEMAFNNRISAFVEAPVRFLNPEVNDNTTGMGDMNAGFKAALLAGEGSYYTFQFRTYIPTGDSDRGLGTNHVSLEPALLFYQPLAERLTLFGELRDWIPVGGSDFEGNVIRYGAGLGYDVYRCGDCFVTPIVEFVGWTVLNGKESDLTDGPFEAGGDTIVNAKVGARVGFGQSDIYAGYGRALTGDVWYKDIFRVEYRIKF